MKKFILILFLLLLASAIVIGVLLFKGGMDKTILTLKNGTMLEVDNTWETGDIFFYEVDGEQYILNKNEVKSVGEADSKYYIKVVEKKIANIAHKTVAIIKDFSAATAESIKQTFPAAFIIIGATLLCIVILIITHVFVKAKKQEPLAKPAPAARGGEDNEITRLDIVRYFLNIFKLQIQAPPDAPSEIAPLSAKSSGPNYIYELRISDRGAWVKRRLTIGPLGEEIGSKSQCFYVIYDVHLVVKIPTRPIDDFEQYIESINKEGHIVEKLAPRECVTPKVSVILNLFHKFADSDHLSSEKLEDKYVAWLRKNPDYQNNLKIKNSFIYFMDFSKFYFLGHIIDGLHDLEDSIPGEIIENPESIWEASKFKGRYGKNNESVFYEIREVYNICAAESRKYIDDAGEGAALPLYRIQSWFLTHLAGKEIITRESGVSDRLVPDLNRLIRNILSSKKTEVESYRKTIREYVYKIHLDQNKPKMAGIIINLLDLLAWLGEKQVAMRDLKPDNLLVAGDPSKYPRFLMCAKEYSLGIIDVETAVIFEKSKYKKNQQPLLGGTPFYATPSHFFVNQTLQQCFGSFRKILHFQDWHAMAVMIFKVVTGDLLFEQTAKLFAYIKEKIRQSHHDKELEPEIFKEISRTFWKSASAEFQMKLGEKEEALKSVFTTFPDNVKQMFLKLLAKDQKTTAEKINSCISAQAAFQSAKSRDLLHKSSHAKIVRFKNHLKNKFKTSPNPNIDSAKVLEFLDDLAHLKRFSDQQKLFLGAMNNAEPTVTAYDVLMLMFNSVYYMMFDDQWQSVQEEDVSVSEPLDDEATTLEAYP